MLHARMTMETASARELDIVRLCDLADQDDLAGELILSDRGTSEVLRLLLRIRAGEKSESAERARRWLQ